MFMPFPRLRKLLPAIVLGVVCLGARAQTPLPVPDAGAAPAADGSPDAVAVLPGDYRLAPDDQVDIAVEGHPEFDKSVTVLPNGTFSYFHKTVQAANLSQDALTGVLTRDLKGQLRYPQVTVSVRQAHVRQVSVLGAARAPGKYPYLPGMRVIDALADSGGPAQADELTDVTLYTDGGAVGRPIDLVRLMQGTDPSLNAPVRPGDVLIMQARNPATAMVLIRGQVAHEGQYPVRHEGATVMAMLTQAGGMLPSAGITHVQLTHDGQTRLLNLRRATLFDATDPVGQTPVAAGDTLAVPLNNAKYIVWGEVRSPSVYGLPDGEPVTVTKALALAGTPTPDADMKTLTVVRTGPDGRTTYIPVNEDNVVRNRRGGDIDLQDGDILIVPKRNHSNTPGSIYGGVGALFSFNALSNLLRGGL